MYHENMNYEGIEIGAVSVKWARLSSEEMVAFEVMRHEGDPGKAIKKILATHKNDRDSVVMATGQAAKSFLKLPYRSETECMERALTAYELKPDMLLSLGGETFSVYPMKNGVICNIISSSKCAAGTGEFIVQQFPGKICLCHPACLFLPCRLFLPAFPLAVKVL